MIFTTLKPLILASHSPRRQEYLFDLGIEFTICGTSVDEQPFPGEAARDYVRRVAHDKARAVGELHRNHYIVAADTAVCVEERILGKPKDEEEAVRMLLMLAGRTHIVRTGLCVSCVAENVAELIDVSTEVVFSPFSEITARAYVRQGESLDKAGSYGIQGKGGFLVERIAGSYSNVVGLPMAEMVEILVRYGVVTPGL